MIPRTTRAQAMDVLSSMATIAGYKAVLWAAERLPKMFPMMTTAAGTLTPSAGTVNYHCIPHASIGMKGTVIVH